MAALENIITAISVTVPPAPGWIERVQNHPVLWLARQPLFWATIGILLGPYLFLRGFQLLNRKRMIMNIPRSTIRAASLGEVEISGKAAGPYTLVSPLANADCYYYRVLLRVLRPGERRGNTLVEEMCTPLFVDDGTGQMLVDPRGADLLLPGQQADGVGSESLRHVLARHGYREGELVAAREMCIQPGDSLFVLGRLQENLWAKHSRGSTFQRIGPGFVTESEAMLQQSQALPDTVMSLNSRPPQITTAEFDLYPPVILMKGRAPFVISNQSERQVLAQLNWTSVLYIWAGPLLALASVWEILHRLHAWGLLPAK